jgi:hypothetical protein
MIDRRLVFEDFADKVGGVFVLAEGDMPSMPLVLKEVQQLNPAFGLRGVRPPFSLMFLAKQSSVLPQRIYRLKNDGLGEIEIFLVPVGKDAEGVSYQATFN